MGDIRAVVVGDNNVGKTSLCVTFSTGQFPSLFTPMECNRVPHEKDLFLGETLYHIQCIDTEGHDENNSTRAETYPDTNVILLCFSLSGPNSLKSVQQKWLPELQQHAPRVPILLVGCKSDLRKGREAKNLVTKKAAKSICKKIKAVSYVECSALKKIDIEESFLEVIRVVTGKTRSSGKGGCTIL